MEDKERNSRKKKEKTKSSDEINRELSQVENQTKNREILSNSIQDLQRNRMEMDFKHKHKNINIQETQNILDEIDQSNEVVENTKKVKFDIPDDTKSEVSDGSDLEIDLESFEKSSLED